MLHNPVTLDLLALPEAGSGAADGAAATAGAGAAAEIQHFALPCAECVLTPFFGHRLQRMIDHACLHLPRHHAFGRIGALEPAHLELLQ